MYSASARVQTHFAVLKRFSAVRRAEKFVSHHIVAAAKKSWAQAIHAILKLVMLSDTAVSHLLLDS